MELWKKHAFKCILKLNRADNKNSSIFCCMYVCKLMLVYPCAEEGVAYITQTKKSKMEHTVAATAEVSRNGFCMNECFIYFGWFQS